MRTELERGRYSEHTQREKVNNENEHKEAETSRRK